MHFDFHPLLRKLSRRKTRRLQPSAEGASDEQQTPGPLVFGSGKASLLEAWLLHVGRVKTIHGTMSWSYPRKKRQCTVHIYTYLFIYTVFIVVPLKLERSQLSFIQLNCWNNFPIHIQINMLKTLRKKLSSNAKAESWERPFKAQHTSFFTPSLPRAQRHLHKP